jgi:hypothetical protein
MPTHRDEILLIHQVVTHPAGYNIDLFGDLVEIQGNDQGTYEVAWCPGPNAKAHPYRSFKSPLRAAAFFVWKRHKLGFGVDYDEKACKEAGLCTQP